MLDWKTTTSAQRLSLTAAFVGYLLDSFDVMLYALIITRLRRHDRDTVSRY